MIAVTNQHHHPLVLSTNIVDNDFSENVSGKTPEFYGSVGIKSVSPVFSVPGLLSGGKMTDLRQFPSFSICKISPVVPGLLVGIVAEEEI
jgi:hypothetical protein